MRSSSPFLVVRAAQIFQRGIARDRFPERGVESHREMQLPVFFPVLSRTLDISQLTVASAVFGLRRGAEAARKRFLQSSPSTRLMERRAFDNVMLLSPSRYLISF